MMTIQEIVEQTRQRESAGTTVHSIVENTRQREAQKPARAVETQVSPISGAVVPATKLNLNNSTFTQDKAWSIWEDWQAAQQKRQAAASTIAQDQARGYERTYSEATGEQLKAGTERARIAAADAGALFPLDGDINSPEGQAYQAAKEKQIQAEQAWNNWQNSKFKYDQSKALGSLSEEDRALVETLAAAKARSDEYYTIQGMTEGKTKDNDTSFMLEMDYATKALLAEGYTQDEIDSLVEYQRFLDDEEKTAQMNAETAQFTNEHPFLANATSVLASPAQGIGAINEFIRSTGYKNDYAPLNINSPNFAATQMTETIRGQAAQNIQNNVDGEKLGQTLSFLYQTGMSIADSATLIASMGPASVYVMGTNAAAGTAKDITERGGSVKQAFTGAVAAGAIEILTEKFSVENLLGNAGNPNVIGSMLRQAGIEASEEMTSEVLNVLADAANMGSRSNYQLSVSYYRNNKGMSEEDAKRAALLDVAEQVFLSGLGGALSGGVMAGAMGGMNYAGARVSTNSQISSLLDNGYQTGAQYAGVTGAAQTQQKTAKNTETNLDYYFDASDTSNSWQDRTYTENGKTYMQSSDNQRMYEIPSQDEIKFEVNENGTVVLHDDIPSELDKNDYRDFVKAYAELNLISKYSTQTQSFETYRPITVKSTGDEIIITQTGINDVAKKIRGAGIKNKDNVSSILLLDKLIENSVKKSEADNKHSGINRFTYYESSFEVGGRTYNVTLDIKNAPEGDRYHYHSLEKIEVAPIYGNPADSSTESGIYQENGATYSNQRIPQKSSDVNTEYAQSTANDSGDGLGAADAGFDPYSQLQNQKSQFHDEGANAVRTVDVPTTDLEGRNVSKTASTAMGARVTNQAGVEAIEQAVVDGRFSYFPITDNAAYEKANSTIRSKGWDAALSDWTSEVRSGKVSKDIVALGQALYNNALNSGETKTAVRILTDYSQALRSGAQATQAASMMRKLSPEYQLYGIVRSVENLADSIRERFPDVEITLSEELQAKYLEAADEFERQAAVKEIYRSVADQVPSTWTDKWNAWRYLSMLGNFRTHIRNISGNAVFMPVRMMKNAIASGIEAGVNRANKNGIERTKAVLNPFSESDRALLKAAWADYGTVSDQILEGGKYSDVKSEIDKERTIFKNNGTWGTTEESGKIAKGARKATDAAWKALDTLDSINSKGLELEDAIFSKTAYAESLAGWLKANGVTAEQFLAAIDRESGKGYNRGGNTEGGESFDRTGQETGSGTEGRDQTDRTLYSWDEYRGIGESVLGDGTDQRDIGRRTESYADFLRRTERQGPGQAAERKEVDGTLYAYIPAVRPSQNALSIQDKLAELGVDSFIFDGDLEANRDGVTTTALGEAATLRDGSVGIRNSTDMDARNVAGHEFYHVAYRYGMTQEFHDAVVDNLIFQEQKTQRFLSQISKRYFDDDFDYIDEYERLYKELAAYICGDIHEGEFLFRDAVMFINPQEVLDAWERLRDSMSERGGTLRESTSDGAFQDVRQMEAAPLNTVMLDEARAYAIKEAQKATYRDFNDFSDFVSRLGRNYSGTNKAAKAANALVEGVLPFKRTPANILVRAVEYSPAELIKGLTYDLVQVKRGNMTAADAIDHISSGLTGTAILGLGALLSSAGLLTGGSFGDDDDDQTAENTGRQEYAVEIGGKSYTLDWLAPAAMPLFIGAELYNLLTDKSKGGLTLNNVLNGFSSITQPLLEMSMLSSLSDLLDNITYADNKLFAVLASAATNYITQAFPTLFGQIERVTEQNRESTWVDRTSQVPTDIQVILGKTMNKLPGEYQQYEYIDAWGRKESNGDFIQRLFYNMVNPSYVSELNETEVDAELQRLKDAGIDVYIPSRVSTNTKIDDEPLTMEEYSIYATEFGSLRFDLYDDLIHSEAYKALDDNGKNDALNAMNDFAKSAAADAVRDMRGTEQKNEYANIGTLSDISVYEAFKEAMDRGKNSGDWSNAKALFESGVDVPEDVIDNLGTDYTKNKAVYDVGIDLGQYHDIKDAFNTGYTAATDNDEATTADYTAIDAAIDAYNSLKQSQRSVIDDVLGAMNLNKAAGAAAKGIDTEQWFDIVNTYKDINKDEDKNATQKQTELEYIIDTIVGLTRSQKEYAKDAFNYSTVLTADADRYNALVNSGLTSGHAKAVFDSVSALTPKPGENSVSVAQKLEAISGTRGLTDKEKYTAFSEYSGLSSGDRDKAATAQAYGVPADVYAAAFSAVAQARKNKGSSSLRQSELSAALSGVDSSYYYILFRIFSSSEYLEWVYAR